MPVGELTSPEAVERALAEFDELGRDAFLAKYRFGRAKRWYVERDGKLYDSKAIVGAAIGYQHPERGPMWNDEFSGGEQSVKAKLESLGFTVVDRPDEGAEPRQAWLFQSNPDYYDIDRALRELPAVEWTVRGHVASVHAGDPAYIWRAGRQAGVVAVGTVLTEPAESGPNLEERPYWRQPDRYGFDDVQPRIRVSIDRVVEPPLLRTTLREDPVLSNLLVIRAPRGTLYEVPPEHQAWLQELLAGRQSDFEESLRRSRDGGDVSREVAFDELAAAIRAEGLSIDDDTLRRYHLSLNTRRGFVILAGVSGTGKTWLAEALR